VSNSLFKNKKGNWAIAYRPDPNRKHSKDCFCHRCQSKKIAVRKLGSRKGYEIPISA